MGGDRLRGTGLRFDDRLATVLALPREDAAARAAAWRQIVDLLAQAPAGAADPLPAEARSLLNEARAGVPQAARAETMAALVGRRVHAGVVRLLADETPAVAAPLIGRVRLEDGEWLFLLPRLPVAVRALLRHRRDLSATVRTGLASFGASDFALPGVPEVRPETGAVTPEGPEVSDGWDEIAAPDAKASVHDAQPATAAEAEAEAEETVAGAEPAAPPETEAPIAETDTAVAPGADVAPGAEAPPAVPDRAATPSAAPPAAAGTLSVGAETVLAAEEILESRSAAAVETSSVVVASVPDRAAPSVAPRDAALSGGAAEAPAEGAAPISDFRFETNADGVILWVEGAPRAALIGFGMAQALSVPDHVPQPFRRAPFRDGRLTIPGGAPTAGVWQVSGVPVFDAGSGRFTGYRGSARRAGGDAGMEPPGLYGTGLQPEALRQLVHELRTPLNAIVGFGEMIERQVLGPAATPYRVQAGEIVGQGRRLLGVIDDLDTAARGDAQRLADTVEPFAPADLLRRLWPDQRAAAAARGVRLDLAIATRSRIEADAAVVERMFAHLLAVAIGLGANGETIAVSLAAGGGVVALQVGRPAALAGLSEATILSPAFPAGDASPGTPPLGIGFALRLVRTLAVAAGGALEVEPTRFVLRLPQTAEMLAAG